MKLTFKSTLLLLCVFPNAYASTSTCKEPFAGISQNFILQEKLNCKDEIDQMALRITDSKNKEFQPLDKSSYFLKTECVEKSKVLNLNYNVDENYIVNWSEKINSDSSLFKINPTCDKNTVAILDTNRKALVQFTVYRNNAAQDLMAYVLESENSANKVTLRSVNGSALALAKKVFVSGSTCYANWEVSNGDIDPTIISYILAWKDNANFNCNTPPSPPSISPGAAAAITGVVIVGASAIVAGILAWKYRSEIGNFVWTYNRIEN